MIKAASIWVKLATEFVGATKQGVQATAQMATQLKRIADGIEEHNKRTLDDPWKGFRDGQR